MKILQEGHRYALDNFDSSGGTQEIQFIKKERQTPGDELTTVENGTTNEEVLRMLIDRMQYLNITLPCRENSLTITKLEEALMWLEKRMKNRKLRSVEGTAKI